MENGFDRILEKSKHYLGKLNCVIDLDESETWVMQNMFGNALLSQGAVKILWNLSYVYYMFYSRYVSGLDGEKGTFMVDVKSSLMNTLNACRDAVKDCLIEKIPIEEYFTSSPENMPLAEEREKRIIFDVASNAMLFCLLHEHFHCVWKKNKGTELTQVKVGDGLSAEENEANKEEEDWCDKEAFSLYSSYLISKHHGEQLMCAQVGVQIAFLVISSVTCDTGFVEAGHSAAYDRIMKVLGCVAPDKDESWCVLTGILGYEFNRIGIVPNHDVVHDNFKDSVKMLVGQLKEYDEKH